MIDSDDEVRDRQVAEICFPQSGTRASVPFRRMASDKVVDHILDVIEISFTCGPDRQPLMWAWFGHGFDFFVTNVAMYHQIACWKHDFDILTAFRKTSSSKTRSAYLKPISQQRPVREHAQLAAERSGHGRGFGKNAKSAMLTPLSGMALWREAATAAPPPLT